MDEVFKALADPTRRSLLDELFTRGRADAERARGALPMTRFGVMKHLKVLEEAGLVVTQAARPREAPLPEPRPDPARPRPLGEQVRRALGRRRSAGSSSRLEEDPMEKVFEIYIKTTPGAAVGGDHRPRDARASTTSASASTPTGRPARATRCARRPARTRIGEGENLEVDPPRRLVQSFDALWSDDVKSEGTSRVTWEIEPVGDSCRLTVTHDQLREGANDELYGGWPMILSGLKTLLETGEHLTTPGSLMYQDGAEGALPEAWRSPAGQDRLDGLRPDRRRRTGLASRHAGVHAGAGDRARGRSPTSTASSPTRSRNFLQPVCGAGRDLGWSAALIFAARPTQGLRSGAPG